MNKKMYHAHLHSTPDQAQSDGKGPDKIDRWASVEEIQDEDDIPGPNHDGNGDNDDIKSDKDDCEKSASTAAAMIYTAFTEMNISGKDPKLLKEAMNSPKWPEWEKAIWTELETLQRMGTWELVNAPEDRKPIINKWVFVRKYDKDGNLQKYKACLVARGFSQMPGMDFNETFSLVVRLETIHMILALAVAEDWEIQWMDVKGAYLNGKLKETIYMEQPRGYSNGTSWICQLIKTLYRLKQSGWEWNEELDTKLSRIRFKCLYTDPCLYIWCEGNSIEIITVWVDDLLLFMNCKETMVKLKNDLKKLFNITDLGEPNKLVGLEFMHDWEQGTWPYSKPNTLRIYSKSTQGTMVAPCPPHSIQT